MVHWYIFVGGYTVYCTFEWQPEAQLIAYNGVIRSAGQELNDRLCSSIHRPYFPHKLLLLLIDDIFIKLGQHSTQVFKVNIALLIRNGTPILSLNTYVRITD